MNRPRIFLLSPAHCGGKRAALLHREGADFPLARRVRDPGGAPLGEVFSFLSGLYFRGKISYATRFARPPGASAGALVITTDRGLVHPSTRIDLGDIAAFASVPIDLREPRYRDPLTRSLVRLAEESPGDSEFVLLGSISTAKYLELLLDVLGARVRLPEPFVGMGDMQRGALMLRSVESGEELPYVDAAAVFRAVAGRRTRVPRG